MLQKKFGQFLDNACWNILDAFSKCFQTDGLNRDSKIAFIVAKHNSLVWASDGFGLSLILLCWVKSYLSERNCVVKITNSCLRTFVAISGVSQGSHC